MKTKLKGIPPFPNSFEANLEDSGNWNALYELGLKLRELDPQNNKNDRAFVEEFGFDLCSRVAEVDFYLTKKQRAFIKEYLKKTVAETIDSVEDDAHE